MKKLVLTLAILAAFALSGTAQQGGFAPQGAEWYFDVFNPWGTHPEYQRFFVEGDTIIQGHQCSIIDQRFVDTGHDGGEYVYEEDNKVYWFNPTTNAFTTLYDFDAEAGELWDYEVGDCTHQVIVDSVGSATWNGHTYRTQWVRFYEENLPIYYSGKIMEGIGYERGLFPSIYVCDGLEVFDAREIEYLRCYVKDGEMLYHEGDYDCDAVGTNTFCWDGTVAEAYAGGDGTEENPYQIANAKQLALLAQQTNDGTGGHSHYILTNDICLNGSYGLQWIPIGDQGYFMGVFDGNGHTISDMFVSDKSAGGLFARTNNATIKNIAVSNSTIQEVNDAGFIVGWAVNTSITNCSVDGTISYSGNASCTIGGVVGHISVDYATDIYIRNCVNNTTIQANDMAGSSSNVYDVGGIVGQAYVDMWSSGSLYIVDCCNNGDLYGRGDVGGIVGSHEGYAYNCDNYGQINSLGASGGIVGYNEGVLKNCHNHAYGAVTGKCAGGIVGYNLGGYISSCVNNAPVCGHFKHTSPASANMVGGILGYGENVWNCYNTGDVTFTLEENMEEDAIYVGGIGGNIVKCKNSYNVGTVASSDLQYARCGIIAGCFYETKNVYWYGDYDMPVYGTGYAPEGSCAFHSGDTPISWVLNEPQYGTVDLVAALNAGASEIESLYPAFGSVSHWKYDDEEVNGGFPVLKPDNSEDDELEAYCEAPFNFGGSPISDQGTYGAQLWWNKPFASHWFHYDEKPYAGSVYRNSWGIKIPAEEIQRGDLLTHVAFYRAGGQDQAMEYRFAFGFEGETEPDSWDYLPGNSVRVEPGPDGWVMAKLGSPIECIEGKCLWIVLEVPNVMGNPAAYCQASGNPNACWSSGGSVPGEWMIRGYFTNDVGYNDPGYNEDLDHYNIYRGSSLEELEKIAEVGRDEEEYFDTLQQPFGDYYYQLTASYTDGRESVPAKGSENPHSPDYVYFHVGNISSLGSEWYYEIENEDGSITYQHLEYDADTTVNNKDVKIIIRTNTLYDKGGHNEVTREYIYEDFGKVYWWNETLQNFTMLYDLGAQVGDSWVIRVGEQSIVMHVDSVEQYEYEGQTYRMLHVSDADDLFSGTIMSGIGHLTSFFPEKLMTRGKNYRVEGIRCYWREGQLVFKYGDRDCDEVYEEWHNGIDEDDPSTGLGTFAVYPNPTDGTLYVQTVHAPSLPVQTYRITNLMGQTLMSGNITCETQRIDVSALLEGMYFIIIGNATQKVVVNK